MQTRRNFIGHAALTAGAIFTSNSVIAGIEEMNSVQRLTILHTNDVHSRLEPFPMDGSKNQGLGGVAPRAAKIKKIRSEQQHVLLLAAGDIFQGTPFFNLYKGEPEIKAMTAMGYDAVTMGNHDFDLGLENFALQMQHASFPVLLCNYDFSGTAMENKFLPYTIVRKGKLKIGITGVGIELRGLVPDNLYGSTKYLEPIQKLNETADFLKKEKGCDMVICLSHLGSRYKDNKVSDEVLAKETEHVDVIIGGHTHSFFDAPLVYKNKKGDDVLVNQVGWAGIVLGRMDFEFERGKKKNLVKSHTVVIGEKTNE